MWDNILQYLKDNKDVLGWLFGSGVFLVVARFAVWLLKEYRLRKIRSNDNFPFKIIPPNSNVAKEILGGADDDPLTDRNIPYQQRIQGRNTRRELEELIEDNRWILITGRTGLGKTREAVQLAQSLNNEGWTILYLTREAWLDAPAKLPTNVPERKLVFFLDDLNKKCLSSKAEVRPNVSESLTLPIYEPFQTRLQRALEAFDNFCGKGEIKVIATARNEKTSEYDEPSEWDKLGWTTHNGLWGKFKLVDLPKPDKASEQKLLGETASKADILIKQDELSTLAKRNDGTFRNLVENLSSARTEGYILSSENFRDTLKGTWGKRYQKAVQKYPEAKYIYDAIELLRDVNVQIAFITVLQAAEIISEEKSFRNRKSRWKYSSVLKKLIKTENLLDPRDEQIEAKGYQVNTESYLPLLYKLVYLYESRGKKENSLKFGDLSFYIYKVFNLTLTPNSIFVPSKKLSYLEKIYCALTKKDELLVELATIYLQTDFKPYSKYLLQKSLEIHRFGFGTNKKLYSSHLAVFGAISLTQDNLEDAIQAMKKSIEIYPKREISWTILSQIHLSLKHDADAVETYKKAIEFNPKSAKLWSGLGSLYRDLSRYEDAIKAFNKAAELNPKEIMYRSSLVDSLRILGKDNEAKEQELIIRSSIDKENEYNRACFESICGNKEEAVRLLKIALDKNQVSLVWAKQDHDFDFIRDDVRFKELVGLD